MICLKKVKQFCNGDYTKIENYDKAIADTTQTWHCHHRDEIKVLPSGMKVYRSKEELIENGRYYGCSANELIFLTRTEHRRVHTIGVHRNYSKEHNDKVSESRLQDLGKRFKSVYGINPKESKIVYRKEKGVFKRFGKLSIELTEQEINDHVKTQIAVNARKFLKMLSIIKEAINEHNI